MKKVGVGICLLLVMLLVGQGYAQESLQPMTLQLFWVKTVEFAGVLLAKERGWYEEVGIDLSIKAWEPGIATIDEVTSGRAQFGVSEGAELVKARASGAPIKAIAAIWQKSPFCLFSKTSQGIKTPAQLVEKRIGLNNPESVILTKVILANQKLQYDDVLPVQVDSGVQSLVDDEVDVYAGFMTEEMLDVKEQGYEVTYIPGFSYGYNFYGGVYFVTEKMIQEQPEHILKFLQVTLRGWKEAFKAPEDTARLIVEKYQPERSLYHQTESLILFHKLATLGVGDDLIGFMKERYWTEGVDILYEYQQIDRKIPARDLFTLEFLKK